MRRLFVLRHAKASQHDPGGRDFDRPLTDPGRAAAASIGEFLKDRDFVFDLVLASPAARVRQTIACLAETYERPIEPDFREAIYNASTPTLLELLRSIEGEAENVLLVGHNPGLQELVLQLADAGSYALALEVSGSFSTGALARLDVPGNWAGLRSGLCPLVEFIRPRDLAS
ncbi:MAG TPA: histidine phosphatase family protein [Sphingomicrobium sp.]|nr:histidine phosphatase family protein [Sphingomicrobium sp.]